VPLYRIRELKYSYAGAAVGTAAGSAAVTPVALDIPSLDFEDGKTYVLLGPNGSGKTTLLKLMNRLLVPDSGRILFRGADIATDNEIRRKTVYIHQNPLLFSGTVRYNVAYGLKLRNYSREEIDERVERTLRIVGLEGFEKRKSTALSGGEAQRVAIARALVVEPDVLLLDEPTSSVDKNNIGKLEQILGSIQEQYGCSIIISSHDLPFAYRMCDELIKLDEGRMIPAGENIIEGRTVPGDSPYRRFRVENAPSAPEIFCPDIDGEFSKAVVDYDRILLSGKPLESSAQNSFEGRVSAVTPACCEDGGESPEHSHGLVDVSVDIGGLLLTSRITRKSMQELAIEPGRRMYAAFKASAVRLY
jgi:molybdopterin-binding protein